MIASWWALPIAVACIWAGDLINRRLCGWLPDDRPRPGRKQHRRATPLAGILLVPALLPWWLSAGRLLTTAALLLVATIGFLDDRDKERLGPLDEPGMDWRIKALALAVAALLVAAEAHDPIAAPGMFAAAVTLVFVLANALNFLDNTDGVAAGIAAATLLPLALLGDLGDAGDVAAIAASGYAALAFVPWNWPRPRLFLGDGGAYTLGIAIGAAIVPDLTVRDGVWLAAALPLADFGQVVAARLVVGVPPWVGDRRHLTHIAQNAGLPRVLVAPLFSAVAAALALAAAR